MTRSLVQPIPYQGSKRLIANDIIGYLPERPVRFVEPFAGSAAMSIALADRDASCEFWLNDSHAALMALWSEIINNPLTLASEYEELWDAQIGREREFFVYVRERFNQIQRPSDFLYLLARCIKAAVRYNSKGEFNNTPDNRRRGAKPEEMRRRIVRVSSLLKNRVRLTSVDYRDVLEQCRADDLVYMDPPYQGVRERRDRRYLHSIDEREFHASLLDLNHRGIAFALSYDGRTGARTHGELLPDYLNLERVELRVGRSTQATLLGRNDITYESLYLSPALLDAASSQVAAVALEPLFA